MRARWATAVVAAAGLACCGVAACGGGSGGGPKLALGQEAVVAYTAPASGETAAVDTTVGVTVLKVRPGTQAELEAGGFQVDEDDKDTTPYYVDARYENKGQGSAKRNLSVGMEDTKGNSIPTTLVIDTSGSGESFAKCPQGDSGAFDPGQSYESCTLFLVPKGAELDRVRFVSQAPDAKITFTDWAVE